MDEHNPVWDSISCLIIDDDKFSRTFIKTALYQIGIKTTKEASNFEEAAEQIKVSNISIILLDQQMPDKSGLDFAQSLRSGGISPESKDIPVIMITIDTQEKTVMDAKKIGIQEYLVKPISPLALKRRISTALNISFESK